MENKFDRKNHWEHIYTHKSLLEVSWYQPKPSTSIDLITKVAVDTSAAIIDIGGGDSFLVDHLLDLGYTNLTVLDISEAAIKRAQKRLGELASQVTWIVSDVTSFVPNQKYDVWHDRAAFHFLTESSDINAYLQNAHTSLADKASLILGTFSTTGPLKCSGIPIHQYSIESMQNALSYYFTHEHSFNIDHPTPFDTIQNFTFGVFKKK